MTYAKYHKWLRDKCCALCGRPGIVGDMHVHHTGDGVHHTRSLDGLCVLLCVHCHLEKAHRRPALYREKLRQKAKDLYEEYLQETGTSV